MNLNKNENHQSGKGYISSLSMAKESPQELAIEMQILPSSWDDVQFPLQDKMTKRFFKNKLSLLQITSGKQNTPVWPHRTLNYWTTNAMQEWAGALHMHKMKQLAGVINRKSWCPQHATDTTQMAGVIDHKAGAPIKQRAGAPNIHQNGWWHQSKGWCSKHEHDPRVASSRAKLIMRY